jgi:GTPase SAR1 family protein
LKTNERITILHGPKSVGKTTLLKLIHDLFSKKLESVCHTPFQKLMICFDNQTILTVEKTHVKMSSVPSIKLTLQKNLKKSHYEWVGAPQDFQPRLSLPFIENALEHREPVNVENGFVQSTSEKLSFSELIEQYWKFLESDFHNYTQNQPEWLREILDSLPVYFIQTQRLFANSVSEEYEESTRRQTNLSCLCMSLGNINF